MRSSGDRERMEIAGRTVGAVLAGGRSSRFGSRKTLARVAGVPLVARAAAALSSAVREAVVVTGDLDVAGAAGLPAISDRVPGSGPLGGLVTALEWAEDLGAGGLLLVGGDMPFITPSALRRLLDVAAPPAVVPVGGEDRRLQPLCAWYSVDLLPRAAERLDAGDLGLHGFLLEAGAHLISDSAIAGERIPSLLFMNVNTRADLEIAENAAARAVLDHG